MPYSNLPEKLNWVLRYWSSYHSTFTAFWSQRIWATIGHKQIWKPNLGWYRVAHKIQLIRTFKAKNFTVIFIFHSKTLNQWVFIGPNRDFGNMWRSGLLESEDTFMLNWRNEDWRFIQNLQFWRLKNEETTKYEELVRRLHPNVRYSAFFHLLKLNVYTIESFWPGLY